MAKHLTRSELLQQLKQTAKISKRASSAPFTAMAILANYILWKEEKWYPAKLDEYNQRVEKYYVDNPELQELSDRLMGKAEFTIDVVYHTPDDNRQKKTKQYRRYMQQTLMDAEDEINRCCRKYLLIHFAALMDMGYGKKRLCRVRDAMNEQMSYVTMRDDGETMRMRKELMEGVGVYIEMPV